MSRRLTLYTNITMYESTPSTTVIAADNGNIRVSLYLANQGDLYIRLTLDETADILERLVAAVAAVGGIDAYHALRSIYHDTHAACLDFEASNRELLTQ
jgi:hypothetical protein